MKTKLLITLAAWMSLAVTPFAQETTAEDGKSETMRVIVKMKSGNAEAADVQSLTSNARASGVTSLGHGIYVVDLKPGTDVAAGVAAFQSDPEIEYAEPDHIVQILATPNDPLFDRLWGLHNNGGSGGAADADIDAPEGWDRRNSAPGIVVAVIDTGVNYNHEDLRGRMWTNSREIPNNGRDDDGNGWVDDVHGMNAINRSGDPADDNKHGTHVAGTIAAEGNNGRGITGVSWNSRIMACKFLDSRGSGSVSAAISCIHYAVDNGAKILNNSWGGTGSSRSLSDAIEYARQRGVIFVAAAGNFRWNIDARPFYPAGYPHDNIVSVGATDRDDSESLFSNYGARSVDLFAPGSSILSAYHAGSNRYIYLSGTSMAAPHVSGSLALMLQQNPAWPYRNQMVRLLGTVDLTPALRGKCASNGRLNLARALGVNVPQPDSPADDHGNNAATATRVGVPSTTPGRIEVSGDQDWLRFVGSGGTMTIESSGNTDVVGYLYDSQSRLIAVNDDGGAGLNFRIQQTMAANQVFYIAVRGYSTRTGPYSVRITGAAPPDTHGEVKVTGLRSEIRNGDTSPSRADGTNFWQVNVAAGSIERTFRIFNVHPRNTLTLGGATIAGAGAGEFRITAQPASQVRPGQSTALRVRFDPNSAGVKPAQLRVPTNDADENPFVFAIQGEGVQPPQDDFVDRPSPNARAVAANQTVYGRIGHRGDRDVMRFYVPRSGKVDIFSYSSLDVVGRLHLGARYGYRLIRVDDNSGSRANFRIRANVRSGWHHVEVRPRYDGQRGDYRVRIRYRQNQSDNRSRARSRR